jgi:hypothetical protein
VKTTVEYTEAEYIALLTLAEKFTDRIFKMIEAEQAQSHAYRASVRTQGSSSEAVAPDIDEAVKSAPAPALKPAQENEFGFVEPKPAPLPRWAKSQEHAHDLIAQGHQVFCAFAEEWERNLGVEDSPQPDRAELMRALSNGPSAGAVMAFLESKGGLLHALDSIINLKGGAEGETERRARVNLLGSTMCQISSIFFPDFTSFYEHVDIYRKRKGGK